MSDLGFAIAHHLLAFSLAAVLAAEVAFTAAGITGPRIRTLQRLDRWYGGIAGLLLVVGTLRVIYGGKGADFYTANPVFWAKMAAFAAVAVLSIPPTLKIIHWGRRAKVDADFVVPDTEAAILRRWLHLELAAFASIPILAVLMARGVGL
jgi:putative membrane protein